MAESRVVGVFDGIEPEQQERIVAEVKRDLRRELEDEVRERLTRQIADDVARETRRETLREIEERAPTEVERRRFVAYVEEVELDALACASLASDIARSAEEELARSQQQATPAGWALALLTPLSVWAAARNLDAPGFAAVLATLSLALVSLGLTNLRRNGRLAARAREHRAVASDYLIVAERTKAFRMIHVEQVATAAELDALLADLRKLKERRDERFHASSDELEGAREEVRLRIEPPRRIEVDEEDADVALAVEEAQAPVAKRR